MNTLQAEQIRDFIAAIQEKTGAEYVNCKSIEAQGDNYVTVHIEQYFVFPTKGIESKITTCAQKGESKQ